MKNLFVIFLSLIALAGISVGFVSCNNNDVEELNIQEKQNESFLQMQARFEEAGIINMIDNYVLKNKDVQAINEVSTILKDLSNPKMAALRVDYADGAVVYSFTMPDQNMSVIKIRQGSLSRNFVCGTKMVQEKNHIFMNENGLDALFAIDSTNPFLTIANNDESGISRVGWGNCDKLGPRLKEETFDDCFWRNFDNFCCDLTGCMAIITNTELVVVAIALTCIC